MKISFLVTYYNQEKYVRKSIDSILAIDKPPEWEILVGDDGSSDGTTNIVNEYIKSYPDNIKLFVMPREKDKKYDSVKRASANRLNILEHCTGDCFCTLDGDDFYCDKTFVKEAIDIFQKYDDISVVTFGYRYYRDGKLGEEKLLPAGAEQRVDTKYYISNWYLHAGAGVHRILWEKERIDYIKTIGYFDDNDIIINSLNYGEMFNIRRSIYAYRQTGESIYTNMKSLERSILNIQGLDVDARLIDKCYFRNLCQRNAKNIILMYLERKKIKKKIGENQYHIYLEFLKDQDESICRDLLEYESISRSQRRNIKRIIGHLIVTRPKMTIKAIVKFIIDKS